MGNDNLHYKFVRREISVYRKYGDTYIQEKRYLIGISFGNIIVPHPITDFIDKKYYLQSGSINSESAAADALVQFLNFIIEEKNNHPSTYKNVKGISDLRLEHLETYLEHCGELGNKRKTVERKESYLLNFFYFMGIEKKKLKFNPEIELSHSNQQFNDRKSMRLKKLSANLYYKKPKKDDLDYRVKKKDFLTQQWTDIKDKRNIRLYLIREFLLIASKEFPDIAFAVCLQIFGGLRSAEVMNLTKNALKSQNNYTYGEKGLIIQVRDRQSTLFNIDTLTSNEQVKKPRDQSILLDSLVPYLYRKHLEWLEKKKNFNSTKSNFTNEIALFINNSGKPMKTHTYRNRFNSLKEMYLGMLKATPGRYEDFKDFQNTRWSTHICRGAFTNLCIDAGFSAAQTSIMRGDGSPDAMYDYIDILTASKKITQTHELISEAVNHVPLINGINLNYLMKEVLNGKQNN